MWSLFKKTITRPPVLDRLISATNNLASKHDKRNDSLSTTHDQGGDLFADNHDLDVFYTKFEDKFRGSEHDIKKRLEFYLPYFKNNTLVDFNNTPVLDIGSGRGELLELLGDNSIRAIGVDINTDMVGRSRAKGHEVVLLDANIHLKSLDKGSLGAVTGFHIAEHIPFPVLLSLFQSCYEVTVPGGFVIFETPNPENILVGSCNFYTDPSHLKPIPPALLKFALEHVGFKKTKINRLQPIKRSNDTGMPNDLFDKMYGPRDYSVIAYR